MSERQQPEFPYLPGNLFTRFMAAIVGLNPE
jgi:hypothetical protein